MNQDIGIELFRRENARLRHAIGCQDWGEAEAAAQARHDALLQLWHCASQTQKAQLASELDQVQKAEKALMNEVVAAREEVAGALQQLRRQNRAAQQYGAVDHATGDR